MRDATIDPWYLENLACPISKGPLRLAGTSLVSAEGRRYPIVDGMPIMLVRDAEQTLHVAGSSITRGDAAAEAPTPGELYLETLGIDDRQRAEVMELASSGASAIDPVVAYLIAATGGNAYRGLVGRVDRYPIPEIRLDPGNGALLLDVGCNWGRWSIAAARKGYQAVGIDPSLGAVMAARRVARQLGLANRYVVGDARFLPFAPRTFDVVFSYSVLQHFRKSDVAAATEEIGRVLVPGGTALVQMPNAFGVVSLLHQARHGFREGSQFAVRYWTLPQLERVFGTIGDTSISIDCFFGLGLQRSDAAVLPPYVRLMIAASERLRSAARTFGALRLVADSVYVSARKSSAAGVPKPA